MAAAAERALRASIKTRVFDRAYYFYGEDAFLTAETLREVLDAAVDPATRDFNLDVRDAAQLDAGTLGTLLATPPMMADRRVVVVRDVGALKKDARAALDRWLASPAPDVVLVLVAGAAERAKPDKTLAARTTAVEFPPLTEDRVTRWIQHYASQHGARIGDGAASLLQQAVGNDLAALAMEVDKLSTLAGDGEITEESVGAVVGVRRGETLADLLDRVAARDARGALAMLPAVLEQPKVGAVPVVMALATQTLALGWGAAARGRADYFGLLRDTGGGFTGRSWTDAVAAWQRAGARWTGAETDAALDALLAADIALKQTTASGDEQILATLVLSLCAGAGA